MPNGTLKYVIENTQRQNKNRPWVLSRTGMIFSTLFMKVKLNIYIGIKFCFKHFYIASMNLLKLN